MSALRFETAILSMIRMMRTVLVMLLALYLEPWVWVARRRFMVVQRKNVVLLIVVLLSGILVRAMRFLFVLEQLPRSLPKSF